MKFAKELDDDLVPEWRAKYFDYKACRNNGVGYFPWLTIVAISAREEEGQSRNARFSESQSDSQDNCALPKRYPEERWHSNNTQNPTSPRLQTNWRKKPW